MSAHQVVYEGPASHAVQAATLLADADGINLRSSQPPERTDETTVRLVMTIEGTTDDILDAVGAVRRQLPAEASLRIGAIE